MSYKKCRKYDYDEVVIDGRLVNDMNNNIKGLAFRRTMISSKKRRCK